MIRIVNDLRFPVKSELISGTDRTLFDAFRTAFEKGQLDIVREINQFQQKLLFDSFGHRAPEIINQLIFLPTYFYQLVIKDEQLRTFILNSVTVAFKTSSFFFKESTVEKSDRKFDRGLEMVCAEKFYEGVLTFYHYVSMDSNTQEIKSAFSEFNQMKGDFLNRRTLHANIRELILKGDTKGVDEIKELYDKTHYSTVLHRRAALCLKAWFVFLYSMGELTYDRFILLYNVVELRYHYFDELLDDLIFIRENELRNFLGVSNWDYKERASGKVYSPPSVRNWILHGLIAIILKGDVPSMDNTVIVRNRDFHFLPDNINQILGGYKQDLSKWEEFLGLVIQGDNERQQISTKELFDQRSREVLNIFEKLRRTVQDTESMELAEAPLDQQKVELFKQELANKWARYCVSYGLFYYYGNVEPKDSPEGLPSIGLSFFMDKFKIMFVENAQTVYGSGDIGSDVGRRTDNTFIDKLVHAKTGETTEFENLAEALSSNLATISGKGYEADLIIIPPEFMYATNLTELEGFSGSKGNEDPRVPIWGYFRDIPIISFYVTILRDQLIILSFKQAVRLEIFDGYEYCENKLHIDIRELTSAEVDAKIAKNQYESPAEKIKARNDIRSSLYLDIWSKARFSIHNPDAFTVTRIKGIKV